jgi:hypothetical protein
MSNILPMPVAAAIINGARIVDLSVKKTDIDRSDVVRAWVREATFVQAQPAADMLLLAADTLEKSADYPPLRAPLPLIWIEWTRDSPDESPSHYFAIVQEVDPSRAYLPYQDRPCPEGTVTALRVEGGWLVTAGTPLMKVREVQPSTMEYDLVMVQAGMLTANINERGHMLGMVDEGGNFLDGLGAIGPDADALFGLSLLKPAALAVGLMNCKNVHTELRSTGNIHDRKKRKQSPKLDYHVIVLPSPGGGGEGAGGHRDVRQHKVRGHFRTYTADKPLLGRAVGTYWWPWHLRGDAERGRIIADYKLTGD